MADSAGLVDLSLFAESPTNHHSFSVPRVPRQRYGESPIMPRYRSHTVPSNYANKPLPPLPSRRLCPRPRYEGDSRCILKRIQRIGSNEQPTSQTGTLLQRRNPLSPPALTLSVPQSQPWNRNPASAMVWIEDEQMWIIAGESQREPTTQPAYQTDYPSPPSYTPRAATRSEPSSSVPPPFDLTPPLTPVQYQLQSLMQPSTQDDEERCSPLFQEAMNSVPMSDPEELFLPPPLDLNTPERDSFSQFLRPQASFESSTSGATTPKRDSLSQFLRPQNALERSASNVSSQSTIRLSIPARSASAGSRISHVRSDSSDTRSFHSAMSFDLTQPTSSANRWAGLARRIASPDSTAE